MGWSSGDGRYCPPIRANVPPMARSKFSIRPSNARSSSCSLCSSPSSRKSKVYSSRAANFLQAVVNLVQQVFPGYPPELVVIHQTPEDLLIAVHTFDKQAFQHPVEYIGKVIQGVRLRRLLQPLILNSTGRDLVEKKLICRCELRAEALVQPADR